MMIGVQFEHRYIVIGSAGDLRESLVVRKHRCQRRIYGRAVIPHVDIKPHLSIILIGKLEDLLLGGEARDAGSRAAEIEWVGNDLRISKISHHQCYVRISRPD